MPPTIPNAGDKDGVVDTSSRSITTGMPGTVDPRPAPVGLIMVGDGSGDESSAVGLSGPRKLTRHNESREGLENDGGDASFSTASLNVLSRVWIVEG
jgi:hypothetical protein